MNDFPWLTALIVVPLVGAVVTAALPYEGDKSQPKKIALGFSVLTLVLAAVMATQYDADGGFQFTETHEWINVFGAHYALGVDGLGLVLVLLTTLLVPVVIGASWFDADQGNTKAFFAWALALEALSLGVFMATDVFLFYVLFEASLVPGYFLIGGFGREGRQKAAIKFLIFQLAGGLVMLAAVVGLYVVSADAGHPTYLLSELSQIDIDPDTQKWLFAGFFFAFAVKAPLFPVHTWLADATEKATPGTSVLLVCVLDKIGTYAMLRYCLGLFPDASQWATPFVVTLALISIVYGALVAIGQDDILRLIGLTSLSHFGFIVLGIFVFTTQGTSGSILYMVNHGVATAALFLAAGYLIHRKGTASISAITGVEKTAPVLAGVFLVSGLAVLGLPGLSPFVSEIMVIIAAFQHHWWVGAIAVIGHRAGRLVHPLDVPAHHHRPGRHRRRAGQGPQPPRGRRARPAAAGAGAVRLLPDAAARRDQPRHHDDPRERRRARSRAHRRHRWAGEPLMDDFVKPTLEYGHLSPLFIIFGIACLGVLVEAFVPRKHRYLVQVTLAIGGVLLTLAAVIWVAYGLDEHGDAARGIIGSMGTVVVDGPSVFLWGLILLFALGGCLLFAERQLDGGVSAFAGQAAALPGTEAERRSAGLEHTEVYPLLLFAVFGMMLFPASGDLLTMFVALEVLSLPLYLLCGLARRRRLLSQEAALKYFVLGAFSSGFFLYGVALIYGYAGSMNFGEINEAVRNDASNQTPAAHRHGHARRRPALQGRRRAVPGLDARRLPGRPDRRHGVHGRRHQGRGVRRDAAALLRRLRLRPLELAADAVGRRDPDHGRRRGAWRSTQRDMKRMLAYSVDRPHRLPAHRRARGPERRRPERRPAHVAAGRALLPRHLRLRHARRVRRGRPWSATPRASSPRWPAGPAWASTRRWWPASSRCSCSPWPASR